MLTNQSGWIAPLKQPFLAKSALYSILKQKVFKIWDISWEYSDTLVEFLDGLADKLKIKSFSKPKTLGKKKITELRNSILVFFRPAQRFSNFVSARKHSSNFRISMKKDQNWVSQFADFFCLDCLIKDTFFHTLLCWMVSVALSRSHYTPRRIRNIDVTIVQG